MSNDQSELDKQGLRGFLEFVEVNHPDQLLRIRESVKTEFETTAIVYELQSVGRSPVVIFENVAGHDMPDDTNIAGNRDLLASLLDVHSRDLPTDFRDRCQNYLPGTGGRHSSLATRQGCSF